MGNRYLTEAVLHNYRGYTHCAIPMTNGLNVIYGEGDAGKSALEKALRWCLLNEKQGKFVNKKILTKGKKIKSKEEVYVQVTFNTGEVIRRCADSSTPNIYYVGHVDAPFEEWTGPIKNFSDVPEEVYEVTRMDSINVGKQFDSHFLLSQKGGDIAKELNKMVNLEIIDTSQSNVNHLVNKIKKEKDAHELNMKQYENELKEYEYLERMDKCISAVEEIEQKRNELYTNKETLNNLLDTVKGVEKEIEDIQPTLDFEAHINAVRALESEMKSKAVLRDKLRNSLSILKENAKKRAFYENILSSENSINSIVEKGVSIQEKTKEYNRLSGLLEQGDTTEECKKLEKILSFEERVLNIKRRTDSIKECEDRYNRLLALVESVENNKKAIDKCKNIVLECEKELEGAVCPTCGNTF